MGNKESHRELSEVQKSFALNDARQQTRILDEVVNEYNSANFELEIPLTSAFLDYSKELVSALPQELKEEPLLLRSPNTKKSLFRKQEKFVAPFNWEIYYPEINTHLTIRSNSEQNPLYAELAQNPREYLPYYIVSRVEHKKINIKKESKSDLILIEEDGIDIKLAQINPETNHLSSEEMDAIIKKLEEEAEIDVLDSPSRLSWKEENDSYKSKSALLKEEKNPDLKNKLHNSALAMDRLTMADILEGRRFQSVEYKNKDYALNMRTGSILKLRDVDPKTVDYTKIAPLFVERFQKMLRREEY